MRIMMAGAGALGSRIALEIVRPGDEFLIIDDGRVGPENVETGTSAYSLHHVGARKAKVLAELMYRRGATARVETRTLTRRRLGLLDGADLIVVTFDNAEARALCCGRSESTLHVGVSVANTGLVAWDMAYSRPIVEHRRGEEPNPVCTHLLGRGLIRATAALAAQAVDVWRDGEARVTFLVAFDQRAGLYQPVY